MPKVGNWAEAGQVVRRRDYTAALFESATLFGVRRTPKISLEARALVLAFIYEDEEL